ncbi:peptidase inhibitor family I36 protein [Streptomyces sp. NPDC059426]|uniref:peptidase inhibitor family I36 protein n=1 Tax=Streptomyces sp. NPDC059426 TaxID=3346827 RepID=UPI0036777F41
MRMRVLLATAGLMASLATVGGAVGQAQAAPSDCARKYLCAYPQTNYRGGAGPVQDWEVFDPLLHHRHIHSRLPNTPRQHHPR